MARYIDEKDVYKLVEPRGTARVHCSQIDELPRADVVPKSEVDDWIITAKENLIRIEELEEELKNIKVEVARKIFEEIEKVFRQHTEGGYYLNGAWFPERLDLYTGDAIAELKKKYTEGNNGITNLS